MKHILSVLGISLIIFGCETVQPIVVNKPIKPSAELLSSGTFADFPKDTYRMPYWYKDVNDDPVKVRSVDFLTIEDLLEVKLGMTLNEVTKVVGKKPFDIVYNQNDGYNVVKYFYKKIYKIVSDKTELDVKKNSTNNFQLGYDFETAYLMFNKYDKLDMILSEGNMQKGLYVLEFAKETYKRTTNEGKMLINTNVISENKITEVKPIEVKRDSLPVRIPIKK